MFRQPHGRRFKSDWQIVSPFYGPMWWMLWVLLILNESLVRPVRRLFQSKAMSYELWWPEWWPMLVRWPGSFTRTRLGSTRLFSSFNDLWPTFYSFIIVLQAPRLSCYSCLSGVQLLKKCPIFKVRDEWPKPERQSKQQGKPLSHGHFAVIWEWDIFEHLNSDVDSSISRNIFIFRIKIQG